MNILFYSSFNQRARDVESLMIAFKGKGHKVISLSTQKAEFIHPYLKKHDIATYTNVLKEDGENFISMLKQAIYFIRFCSKHKIDIVFSHLELPSFVSVVAQYFVKARVIVCRHHINEAALYNFDNSISYKLTYKLAQKVIVVSQEAKNYMVDVEKIPGSKIDHINLAYDFLLYEQPNSVAIKRIKDTYTTDLLLITVCRLTSYKKPDFSIEVVKELKRQGLDVKLLILGNGEMEEELLQKINSYNLQDSVFLLGHVKNVLDYMGAADFIIHPSLLESSCVVIKEAGLMRKPVIVCKGIGDFDEVIYNESNGYIVSNYTFVEEAVKIIMSDGNNKHKLLNIGEKLYQTILDKFSIVNALPKYENFLK